jgi:hypothetical protein
MCLQEFREETLAMDLRGDPKAAPITMITSFLKLVWCILLTEVIVV